MYAIKDLLCNNNNGLYQDIAEGIKIQLEDSHDDGWGVFFDQTANLATFSVTSSSKPCADFTHELLHVDLKLKGLSIPLTAASSQGERIPSELCGFLENELEHHKMYSEFLSLGFRREDFLSEHDSEVMTQRINRDIEHAKVNPQEAYLALLPVYIAAINPAEDPLKQNDYRQEIVNIIGCSIPDKIDHIFKKWVKEQSLDLLLPLGALINELGWGGTIIARDKDGTDQELCSNIIY